MNAIVLNKILTMSCFAHLSADDAWVNQIPHHEWPQNLVNIGLGNFLMLILCQAITESMLTSCQMET